jgi:hypothetical protein
MDSCLGRGQHIGGVLDRPGLEQNLPVILAGVGGEGRRHHQQISPGPRQVAIELGKAHVVTDRQTDATQPWNINDRRQVMAGLNRG